MGGGIFTRYAVTGTDALAVLDELVGAMDNRKAAFAGRVRSVPISPEHPLEFDEHEGALSPTARPLRFADDRGCRPGCDRYADGPQVALGPAPGRSV